MNKLMWVYMYHVCKTNAWQDLLANIYHSSVNTCEQQKHYKITCEYSPLASNYWWVILDKHYCTCKYLYVRSNTNAFLVHLRTSWELSVKCIDARRRAQVIFNKPTCNSKFLHTILLYKKWRNMNTWKLCFWINPFQRNTHRFV